MSGSVEPVMGYSKAVPISYAGLNAATKAYLGDRMPQPEVDLRLLDLIKSHGMASKGVAFAACVAYMSEEAVKQFLEQ